MKNLLFILLTIVSMSLSAQDYPEHFTYTGVVKVDSASATILYSRAKRFVAETYKSGKTVTDLDDATTTTIILKPLMDSYSSSVSMSAISSSCSASVKYTFTIECKDGRYKYTLSDFHHVIDIGQCGAGGDLTSEKPACGYFLLFKKTWAKIKASADAEAKALIEALNKAMNSSSTGAKSDW